MRQGYRSSSPFECMLFRLIVVGCVLVGLIGGTGVVAADSHDNAKACPEDGNPSNGLESSVTNSKGVSLSALAGVNQAYESAECETRLETP